jgi:hypothetical protein
LLIFVEYSQDVIGHTSQPPRYWTADKGKNMRRFLEEFARKELNKDPLVPDTWYNIPRNSIEEIKVNVERMIGNIWLDLLI